MVLISTGKTTQQWMQEKVKTGWSDSRLNWDPCSLIISSHMLHKLLTLSRITTKMVATRQCMIKWETVSTSTTSNSITKVTQNTTPTKLYSRPQVLSFQELQCSRSQAKESPWRSWWWVSQCTRRTPPTPAWSITTNWDNGVPEPMTRGGMLVSCTGSMLPISMVMLSRLQLGISKNSALLRRIVIDLCIHYHYTTQYLSY